MTMGESTSEPSPVLTHSHLQTARKQLFTAAELAISSSREDRLAITIQGNHRYCIR
jgi:hypothetical protein